MPAHDSEPAAKRPGAARRGAALLLLGVALALILAQAVSQGRPAALPEAAGAQLPCVSYAPFRRTGDTPFDPNLRIAPQAIEADLRLLKTVTGCVRTYSAAEFPELPALAQQFGLRLSLGVWLDHRLANNEREIAAATQAAREQRSVERVIAGNETQLHGKLAPAALYAYLDRLRAGLAVPVSTAEPWHIWLRQPELAEHVDFITVHLLPYWEGVPVEAAVEETLRRYAQVQRHFPGKRIVIGEIGWPSGGAAVGVARPTPAAQGLFVRSFLARVQALELDYFLMEAVDQPWKRATEGPVGAHWGLLDAGRQPKFELAGPLYTDPYWQTKVAMASGLGLAAMLPFLLTFAGMRLAGRVAFALIAQAVASFAVLLGTLPLVAVIGAAAGLMAGAWRRRNAADAAPVRTDLLAQTTLAAAGALVAACALLQMQALPLWSRTPWEWTAGGAALLLSVICGAVAAGRLGQVLQDGVDGVRKGVIAAFALRETAALRLLAVAQVGLLFLAAVDALGLVFDARYRPLPWPVIAAPALLLAALALLLSLIHISEPTRPY